MWNGEPNSSSPGARPGPTSEVTEEFKEPRPERSFEPPLLQKANLQAIVSILAIGVLRWRARKSGSSSDIGRKAKNLQI